ncbi:hypothetical protein [Methylobacterium sp. SD21]|uniref:hypothetical protein n=1 Tax=Methylobacterium litchii TaxID=3138810 RepID=UPI00313CB55C
MIKTIYHRLFGEPHYPTWEELPYFTMDDMEAVGRALHAAGAPMVLPVDQPTMTHLIREANAMCMVKRHKSAADTRELIYITAAGRLSIVLEGESAEH